jgi:hypothetical protein
MEMLEIADYALVARRMPEAAPTPRSIIPAQSTLTVPGKLLLVASAGRSHCDGQSYQRSRGPGVVKQQAGASGESGVLVDGFLDDLPADP